VLHVLSDKNLEWPAFSAETTSVLFVQLLMGLFAMKRVHTMFDEFLVIMLYPAPLVIVAVLENVVGLD
jgi:hypothetical protein